MGIRKFNKEGPSVTQFGEILCNFAWMLILKIIAYLILKQVYSFFLKILRRHQAASNEEAVTNAETCDKTTSSEPEPVQSESIKLGRKNNDNKQDIYNRKNVEILLQRFKDRLAKEKLN